MLRILKNRLFQKGQKVSQDRKCHRTESVPGQKVTESVPGQKVYQESLAKMMSSKKGHETKTAQTKKSTNQKEH